jgi:hypothetical protein
LLALVRYGRMTSGFVLRIRGLMGGGDGKTRTLLKPGGCGTLDEGVIVSSS